MRVSKKIWNALKYLLFLGIGIFLIYWQLKDMTAIQRAEFNQSFQEANYWIIIPITGMALLAHWIRAIRWKLLMEPLGYRPKLKNVFAATLVGYFANAAVPRLGEVLRCSFLAKYEKLKFDTLFGTILVERIFDLICFVFFIFFTVLIQLDVTGSYLKEKLNILQAGSGFPIWAKIIAGIAILFLMIYGIHQLRKKFPQNTFIVKLNGFMDGIITGFLSIKNLKRKRAFLIQSFFIWLIYLLQIYIGFDAMEGTSALGLKAACSILTLATLAMIATPGGIGVFPFFIMQTLAMYGITEATGMAFGWLIWGVNTGIVIISGLVSLLALPLMNKSKA